MMNCLSTKQSNGLESLQHQKRRQRGNQEVYKKQHYIYCQQNQPSSSKKMHQVVLRELDMISSGSQIVAQSHCKTKQVT